MLSRQTNFLFLNLSVVLAFIMLLIMPGCNQNVDEESSFNPNTTSGPDSTDTDTKADGTDTEESSSSNTDEDSNTDEGSGLGTDTESTATETDPGTDLGSDTETYPDSSTDSTWENGFFAPYVDASLYPTPKISEIAQATNVPYYVLAFIVAKSASDCTASWGTYYTIEDGPSSWANGAEYFLYDEIEALRTEQGGDVMVSFGGAASVPLAAACSSVDDIAARYKSVIDTLSLTMIDFDVEGAWVADHAPGGSVERRSQAIARLQQDFKNAQRPLDVWFTLPILPSGLTVDGIAVLESALGEGVEIAGVNAMTMDYGDSAAPSPAGQMAQYGIEAVSNMKEQLAVLYENYEITKTDEELWAMVGITPMIGLNDVTTEVFEIQDAFETVTFSEQNSVGMLSMWSTARDHPCPDSTSVQLDCSSTSTQTQDFQFSSVFNTYNE